MGRYEGYLMDTGGVMLRLDVGQSLRQPSRRIVLHYPGNAGKARHLSAKLRQPMSRLNGPARFRFLDCRHVVGGFKAGDRPPADVREKLVLQLGKDFLLVAFRPCRALFAEPVTGYGLKGQGGFLLFNGGLNLHPLLFRTWVNTSGKLCLGFLTAFA